MHPVVADHSIRASVNRLQESDTYLANSSFLEKVKWVRERFAHKLSIKSTIPTNSPVNKVLKETYIKNTTTSQFLWLFHSISNVDRLRVLKIH